MNLNNDELLGSQASAKVGISPIPKFSRPVITTSYATREKWMNAALAGMKRMASDEDFRKDIEQFLS